MLQESGRRLRELHEGGLAKIIDGVHEELKRKGINDLPFPELIEKRKPREILATASEVPAVLFANREKLVILDEFSPVQRSLLEGTGRSIYSVEAKSIRQLWSEYPAFFTNVGFSGSMLDIVPKATQVAIDPSKLVLEGSARRSFYEQLEMIETINDSIQTSIQGVAVGMACGSVYCQLDIARQKENGKNLFADFLCRTPDGRIYGAIVGRFVDASQLCVQTAPRRLSRENIVVVPVVVPIQT